MQFPARANEGDREHRMTKNEGGDRGGCSDSHDWSLAF